MSLSLFKSIFIRSFIARPPVAGVLNCSSLGGAGLRSSQDWGGFVCALINYVAPVARAISYGWYWIALNSSVLFISNSLYITYFLRSFIAWKNQSARHAQKSVTTAFCSRVASDILRSAVVLRKQLFVQPSGTKELAFHATPATRWTPLKQHLSFFAAWTAVCCDFIGAGSIF